MQLSEVTSIFEKATNLSMPTKETQVCLTLEHINRLVHAIHRNMLANNLISQLNKRNK